MNSTKNLTDALIDLADIDADVETANDDDYNDDFDNETTMRFFVDRNFEERNKIVFVDATTLWTRTRDPSTASSALADGAVGLSNAAAAAVFGDKWILVRGHTCFNADNLVQVVVAIIVVAIVVCFVTRSERNRSRVEDDVDPDLCDAERSTPPDRTTVGAAVHTTPSNSAAWILALTSSGLVFSLCALVFFSGAVDGLVVFPLSPLGVAAAVNAVAAAHAGRDAAAQCYSNFCLWTLLVHFGFRVGAIVYSCL